MKADCIYSRSDDFGAFPGLCRTLNTHELPSRGWLDDRCIRTCMRQFVDLCVAGADIAEVGVVTWYGLQCGNMLPLYIRVVKTVLMRLSM